MGLNAQSSSSPLSPSLPLSVSVSLPLFLSLCFSLTLTPSLYLSPSLFLSLSLSPSLFLLPRLPPRSPSPSPWPLVPAGQRRCGSQPGVSPLPCFPGVPRQFFLFLSPCVCTPDTLLLGRGVGHARLCSGLSPGGAGGPCGMPGSDRGQRVPGRRPTAVCAVCRASRLQNGSIHRRLLHFRKGVTSTYPVGWVSPTGLKPWPPRACTRPGPVEGTSGSEGAPNTPGDETALGAESKKNFLLLTARSNWANTH